MWIMFSPLDIDVEIGKHSKTNFIMILNKSKFNYII